MSNEVADESSTSQTKIKVTESTSTWEKIDNDIFVHAVQNTIIEIDDGCSQPNHNAKENISVIMNVQDKTKRNDSSQIKQEKHDGKRNSKYQRKKKKKKWQNTRYSTRIPHKSYCTLCGAVRPNNRSHSHQCRGIFSAPNPWTSERNCMPHQIGPLRGVTNPYNPWYGCTNGFAAKMQSLSPPRADTGGLTSLASWISNHMNALRNVTMISDGSGNSCCVSNNVSMAASSGNLLNVVDSQRWNASGTNDVIHPYAFGNIHNTPLTRDAEKTPKPASIDNPIKAYEEIRTNDTESPSAWKKVDGDKDISVIIEISDEDIDGSDCTESHDKNSKESKIDDVNVSAQTETIENELRNDLDKDGENSEMNDDNFGGASNINAEILSDVSVINDLIDKTDIFTADFNDLVAIVMTDRRLKAEYKRFMDEIEEICRKEGTESQKITIYENETKRHPAIEAKYPDGCL